MPTRRFDIDSPGGYRLSGRIEMPEGVVRGWALFAHCFSCGKDGLSAVRIARALAALGIGTLRFDFAGHGGSGGDTGETRFATGARDLIAAAAAMARADMAPALLVGHSLGGAAVLAAGEIGSVRAVATIGAPFDAAALLDQFDVGAIDRIEAEGEAEIELAGRAFTVGKAFLDDLRHQEQGSRIAALHRPLLVLHAPFDAVVAIDNATKIFLAARHPKSFVSLDRADHLLSRPEDADYAASLICAWASRYLPAREATRDDGGAGDVIAEETGAGGYQVAIRAGGLRLIADEPASVGGLGSGPTPYDLLSAALGACTTMTLRIYADQKALPVGRIRTAVGHRRQPGANPPDLFTRLISFDGDLDAAQRAKLIAIADRCPVHRTLERGARVETQAGDPPADAEPIEAHAEAVEQMLKG